MIIVWCVNNDSKLKDIVEQQGCAPAFEATTSAPLSDCAVCLPLFGAFLILFPPRSSEDSCISVVITGLASVLQIQRKQNHLYKVK